VNNNCQKLVTALRSRPEDGGIWTGPKVARWLEKEIGRKKVGNQRGWDYLKKCKYSWQKPRPKHRKGDEKTQEDFKNSCQYWSKNWNSNILKLK
jgi:transposase